MILIGLGGNLPGLDGCSPQETLERALARLDAAGVRCVARSRWWRSAPVPVSDQPWFINGVARVETSLSPQTLLALLHGIEATMGRQRSVPNAARILDLDLIAFDDVVDEPEPGGPILPHPRMQERRFVLAPLAEIAPSWRHPVSGATATELLARLPLEDGPCVPCP